MTPIIVACLGSSSIAGKGQAYNWIDELKRRPNNRHINILNFGVGGDLACNALERLPSVIASRPNKVLVWVGGNDVLALVSTKARRFFRIAKRLSATPSPESFRENLYTLVDNLKENTSATIALCSLQPIGEAPNSKNSFQRELNLRVEQYSALIHDIASETAARYISIHESLRDEIETSPGQAFTAFNFLPFYRDAFRVLIQHKSPDEVAALNGWRFHTDGIHLNSRSGHIVANLVQQFIEQ